MKKMIKHKITRMLFLFTMGVYFVSFSNCHKVLGQENKTDIQYDLPEDIIDPGPILPGYLSSPKIIKLTNIDQGIKIQWNQINEATGYRIQRRSKKEAWKDLENIYTEQYIDHTVKNGEIYQYKVYAYATNSIDFIESSGVESTSKQFSHLKAPYLSSAKRVKNKKAKVSWKQNKKADGYIVQISSSNKFKNVKTKKLSSIKKTTTNISGLKSKKTSYVRIRAYKINSKDLSYSAWSNIRSIK